MSLRRPSLKSTAYMLLLAAGIVVVGALIFRGVGAPVEPARAVMPGWVRLRLEVPGRYIIFSEQVVAGRATPAADLTAPEMILELERLGSGLPAGGVRIAAPARLDWLYKVLTRRRGHTLGHFRIERGGEFRLKGVPRPGETGAASRSVLLAFARPASLGRVLWLLLGFSGQVCFTLRFLVQWLASERAGRSTVPRAFWYYSMVGGLMILAYAIYTRDPVFIMAYAFNAFIYVRNLMLIRREDRAAADAAGKA